ncbi:MAG: helix-turn-helix domain-containing protein [Holosporaceae bacterium]
MSYQRGSMRSKSFSQLMSSYTLPQEIRNPEALKRRGFSNLKILRRTRGFTLEGLSKLTGISPSYLSRLEAGARRLNTDLMKKLSPVLKCEPADLLGSTLAPLPSLSRKAEKKRMALVSGGKGAASLKAETARDLPIYTLASNDKTMIDFKTAADWVVRPYQLHNIDKAFGLCVADNALVPRFQPGDTLFLHPSKPLSVGCGVLVIDLNEQAHLRTFCGWAEDGLMLQAVDGRSDSYLVKKADIKRAYKVVGVLCA